MAATRTLEINITGIVQGVGFRPFLYNLARDYDLKGYILNRGNAGVRLVLQGGFENVTSFLEDVERKNPKISYIENITTREVDSDVRYTTLEIKKSEHGRGISLTLPPDVAICDHCKKDMRNPELQKYYQYPFIACAVCGPRFTTVTELPYDRERSTMKKFPFCKRAEPESCVQEYSDFNNRRFHAQTFACSVCGPNYNLYSKSRKKIKTGSITQILQNTVNYLNEGAILAVKGIGGVHLVCLADDDVVLKLRMRKGERKYKPFAIMVPNLDMIKNNFLISEKERELLESYRRPIILLERSGNSNNVHISEQVAPGLSNIGFMLPYSGIHHLIFDYLGNKPLVYTSGNKSNIPMGIENSVIFKQLEGLADYFLLHNRPIFQRADDSVARVHNDQVKLIRRSRGYVPEYLPLPFEVDIPGALATGPELSVTGAVLRRNRIFPTQHIGKVTHLETYDFLKNALFHMKNLLQIKDSELRFIACDTHPSFITTKFASELATQFDIPVYPVQHHFAHVLSLMAENGISPDEKVIGIAADGVGYAEHEYNKVWGGEILLCSYDNWKRVGSLEPQPMIGGDRCAKYPARMLASILLSVVGIEETSAIFDQIKLQDDLEYHSEELSTLISQWEQIEGSLSEVNIPFTTSTGRIFDVVSYLLGACKVKTYRGEPAMRLEGLAAKGNPSNVPLKEIEFYPRIKTSNLILDILDLLNDSRIKREDIASKFQIEFGKAFAEASLRVAKEEGIEKIGLTGGVAYNYSFSKVIKERIVQEGFTFLEHNLIPPGDAGISTGQLIGGFYKYSRDSK